MENEFVGQIKQELTTYGTALGEVGRLRLVGILSRMIGLFLLILSVVICAVGLFTFLAVAVIDALAYSMPVWAASLIVGSAYLLLIIIAIACRKQLFIHPFIKLLTKQIKTEEELERKTMEAEHQADMQRVKMACQVENATREIEFYLNFLTRAWNAIRALFKKA